MDYLNTNEGLGGSKQMDWYQRGVQEAVDELGSNLETGLNPDEAARRLEEVGLNELVDRGSKNPWLILWEQFTETMVVILIIAAIISAVVGDLKDAIAIVAIVILNSLLGFRQEYQAEQAMAALKKLAVPQVRVRRKGHIQEIEALKLVPGDIVLLESGNLVPADLRLVESVNLRAQESAMTGESEPVHKQVQAIQRERVPLAERHNMVYMGTTITYGRGAGIVTATGMRTELGGIAEMMQSAGQEQTPLQRRLDQLGKGLALASLILVAVVFVLGLFRGEDLEVLFLTSISIAVAAVPEGLPAVVTIALALGARRMLKRRALIRKLPAVETLGSVTVICSDKTGTLTENRMTVTIMDFADHQIDMTEEERIDQSVGKAAMCANPEPPSETVEMLKEHPALTLMLAGGALCNDASIECDDEKPDSFHLVGDPTEAALVVAAARLGLTKAELESVFPRQAELPFDSDRKRMTTVHPMPKSKKNIPADLEAVWNWEGWLGELEYVAFTKGSVDGLLNISDRVWVNDHIEDLDESWHVRIEAGNADLAKRGMRVLGIACRSLEELPAAQQVQEVESELIFLGLVGMIDPARSEVKAAVQTCKQAGIRPMMITGDHPLTARYIANELGILVGEEVLTGHDLEQMEPAALEETVAEISVYARVSPEHKLKIVQALQARGEIAAMTGDGVNDAPALKKADIGVAMGITGTDVSKEAADMVLTDDNFATIVAAVEEGRAIYDNIRKFIKYTLTSNMGEIWVMLLAPFLGMPLPLLPLQILWINLVTDGLPGLALGVEPAERDTMRRPPYPPDENIFARGVGRDILVIGLLMGLVSLGVGFWYWRVDNPVWQTMVFSTLTLSEMTYVMAIRSSRDSLFTIGLLSNRALLGAVVLTTVLQIAVIYLPFAQDLFNTTPLLLKDLLVSILLSTSLFWVVEAMKWLARRRAA
jgi:Ca2+-transporting ATPase